MKIVARFLRASKRIAGVLLSVFVFFVVVAPVGLLLRVVGMDPLHRRWLPLTASYWVPRFSKKLESGRFQKQS